MTMKTAKIYARPETEFWNSETLDRFQITAAFCVYIVPDDGAETVDCMALPVHNVFHHAPGTHDSVIEAAREELDGEGLEPVAYLMRRDVDGADRRFTARAEASEDFNPDADPLDEWREEYAAGLGAEPAILDADTFEEWQEEKRAARRALNVPPIANFGANGLDNLPLFVAAANRLLEGQKPAAERLARIKGECAAHKAQKARLYAAGLTWPLPPAEAFRAARA